MWGRREGDPSHPGRVYVEVGSGPAEMDAQGVRVVGPSDQHSDNVRLERAQFRGHVRVPTVFAHT